MFFSIKNIFSKPKEKYPFTPIGCSADIQDEEGLFHCWPCLIFLSTFINMKPSVIKEIHEHLVPLCLQLQQTKFFNKC